MATKCVYIYARISEDRAGRAEGVQAQEKWGREYAAEHFAGVPVRVFSDNDLTAAKDDVFRPEFERMREGIRRGECAAVWAVEQNRLTRIESVWFTLASELVGGGVSEVHTKRNGVIDVGGVVAGIMAVLGAHEIKQIRKRVTDKLAELASQGRPPGGTCFGYTKRIYTADEKGRLDAWREAFYTARRRGEDMRQWREENPRPVGGRRVLDEQGRASMQVVPEQARWVRQAAEWILDGWTAHRVAREMNRQGVKGADGGEIYTLTVKRMLTNPSIAGLRIHHGEVAGAGTWEPILDEATWYAVRAALEPKGGPKRRAPRKYLLTGWAECGPCERPMAGTALLAYPQHGRKTAGYNYVHSSNARHPGFKGCGATVSGPQLERHVIKKLFDHLATLSLAPLDDEHAERRRRLVVELQAIRAQRAEWIKAKDAGQLDLAEYLAAKSKFDEEEKRLGVELAGLPEPTSRIDPDELRAAWPDMPLHRKRRAIEDYIEKIIVHPYVQAKRPSMHAVARRAGVSASTVHTVYNAARQAKGRTVSPETRRKILAAAEELGYEYQPGKFDPGNAFNPDRIEIIWR